jgi:hypothetical protein
VRFELEKRIKNIYGYPPIFKLGSPRKINSCSVTKFFHESSIKDSIAILYICESVIPG